MIYARVSILIFLSVCCWACSDEPVGTNPNPNNNDMGQVSDGDMLPDLTNPDPENDMPTSNADQRMVIQPVSGSGIVKGTKFRAHIQVGRIVDVSPGK